MEACLCSKTQICRNEFIGFATEVEGEEAQSTTKSKSLLRVFLFKSPLSRYNTLCKIHF